MPSTVRRPLLSVALSVTALAGGAGIFALQGASIASGATGVTARSVLVKRLPGMTEAPSIPGRVCGNPGVLTGPNVRPRGAVRIPAGRDNPVRYERADTTYWFAPGLHTLGTSAFSQFIPAHGSTYIGGPGAVLSGQGMNEAAFTQQATDVTIEYLTIANFAPPGGQGAVNSDSAVHWTIRNNTIRSNLPGAGLMMGTGDVVSHNCLTANGEYGFDVYSSRDISSVTGGPTNITLSDNEISKNGTCNWETLSNFPIKVPSGCGRVGFSDCGCSGGGKFWRVDGATVVGNYVYDNYDVGIWADTNNTGFDISGNYIAKNWSQGLMYEVSYNAQIDDNTFLDNAWGSGPGNKGFPAGAIYVSESGGDSRVPGAYSGEFQIDGNAFINNWAGVVLWENANRFCGTAPGLNATDVCTLVDPSIANIHTCTEANLTRATPAGKPDYYDLCRWKTQNVSVSDNVFRFAAADVPACSAATSCGMNGLFSEYGSYPSWSPYTAYKIPQAITFDQGNRFSQNTYEGAWRFMAYTDGTVVPYSLWRTKYHQDLGSNTVRP